MDDFIGNVIIGVGLLLLCIWVSFHSYDKGVIQGNIQVASGEVVCKLETKDIGYGQTKPEWNCQKVDK